MVFNPRSLCTEFSPNENRPVPVTADRSIVVLILLILLCLSHNVLDIYFKIKKRLQSVKELRGSPRFLSCFFFFSLLFLVPCLFSPPFPHCCSYFPIHCGPCFTKIQAGLAEKTSLVTAISVAVSLTNFHKWLV